jgi:hypothetical protein
MSNSDPDYSNLWVDIDVIGDGNCFYRSLYHAALFHLDPTAFKRLLLCFCLNVDEYDNEDTLKAFMKVAAKGNNVPKQLAHEHKFCNAARAALTNEIKYKDLFERMDNADSEDYKSPYAILKATAELGQDTWEATTREFSAGFNKKFRNASTLTTMSEGQFANVYADIVRADREFVTQLEILMVNFMLRHCGLKIHTLNPDGKYRANDIGILNANNLLAAPVGNIRNTGPRIKAPTEEIKLTPLFLMRLPEHYNVVLPASIYLKHFAVLDNIGYSGAVQYTDEDLFLNYETVYAYVTKMTGDYENKAGGRRRIYGTRRYKRSATGLASRAPRANKSRKRK